MRFEQSSLGLDEKILLLFGIPRAQPHPFIPYTARPSCLNQFSFRRTTSLLFSYSLYLL